MKNECNKNQIYIYNFSIYDMDVNDMCKKLYLAAEKLV